MFATSGGPKPSIDARRQRSCTGGGCEGAVRGDLGLQNCAHLLR